MERYGWTFDYVMWGISWANAQMLLSDSIRIDYDHKAPDSSNTGHSKADKIDLNNPKAFALLQQIAGGHKR